MKYLGSSCCPTFVPSLVYNPGRDGCDPEYSLAHLVVKNSPGSKPKDPNCSLLTCSFKKRPAYLEKTMHGSLFPYSSATLEGARLVLEYHETLMGCYNVLVSRHASVSIVRPEEGSPEEGRKEERKKDRQREKKKER